jgi:hypothetical protein
MVRHEDKPTRTDPFPDFGLDNLAHCSSESGILEKPDMPAPNDVWIKSVGMYIFYILLTWNLS